MRPERQFGFAIPTAIFLIVALAALGGFIVTVSTQQQIGSALDVTGARVYQAARAGTEWGLYMAKTASACVATTNIGTIDTVAVTVTCNVAATGDAIETGLGAIYQITATACNLPTGTTCAGATGNPNYVERSITVTAEF